MGQNIEKVAVMGAGVMGSAIAAHLANVGIPCYLMDMVPGELAEQEKARKLTLESPEVRNRLATLGKERALKSKPAAFYSNRDAELITVGNFEDNMDWVKDADWVIEAIVEDLAVKKDFLRKLEPYCSGQTIVSTNTSGISVAAMSEEMPSEFRENFLGTHFFNPPRYMRLLEIIPLDTTRPEVVDRITSFGENVLGKGIVFAKDTPNFIANRIGSYGVAVTLREMIEGGYSIDEVDAITGQAMGRPKTASFRMLDMVGLDVILHVGRNLRESITDSRERDLLELPGFVQKMVENRWLGLKTGQGFYKKISSDGKEEILVLDYNTLDYRPRQKVSIPSLDVAKNTDDVRQRISSLVYARDRAGDFAWKVLKKTLLYCAGKVPEISDEIVHIDRAMRLGFNWELGPFETWDAIGVRRSVKRMEEEGETIPPLVRSLLAKGLESFYRSQRGERSFFDLATSGYKKIEENPRVILLPSLKEREMTIRSNPGASLIDMGDGVACLEFHSKMNAIGQDTQQMVLEALKEVERSFEGLVIGNHGANFSVGANLMMLLFEIQDENWDVVEAAVRDFQRVNMAIKFSPKPVVAAPAGMALGGGCEIALASARIRAAAETYMGLVEVGVGLIPAGGGCKEMLIRSMEAIPEGVEADPFPFVRRAAENIAMAKVSTSAKEAKELGYMRPSDSITINRDHLLYEAKQTVLAMAKEGYRAPRPRKIRVLGESGLAMFKMAVYTMREGHYISEYDAHIARKVGFVLCGGNVLPNTEVTEQYLLDLEREAFLSLCGEPKTQERIQYTLAKGKPLRN
ncbi:MAG: enoyl-CoA hydratase/isomerase family protein [Deltaproteobacteria bacterium]|nr:enoyl-CoA hydratase/isomerase family protein [Deltaproteobacteria bacterium]MBW2122961.1 enoyl-CoA hydratase/isomerase family protein [Deltaproteobacteria bacterium]